MYATLVTAVERGHHWSMLMDMNIDQRLGWQRFRVQYCEIGRYDKKLSHSFIHLNLRHMHQFFFVKNIKMYIHPQDVRISTFRGYSFGANQIYAVIQNGHCNWS